LIFYFVQKIYLQNKKNYFNLILFLSPAYILFPYYDFAGGYRKEIITFLSFVILSYSYYKEIKSTKVIWASLILYIIALFSHEATIFVLPFFIFILLKIKKSKLLSFKKTYTFIIIFIATTLISIILSYLSSTNSEKNIIIVNNTCKYLISIGFDNKICETAFIFIARTFKENLLEVTDSIYPRLTITFLLFFLSILPVFFSNWIENKENKIITIFGIIFILPLFFLAHDFGRWIHIFIFCLFTIILVDKNKYNKKKIPILFLAGYLLLWSVPHYGNVAVGDGFLLKQINLIKLYQNEKYKK
jgi:hypothetical protein